jgi:hypothetical protein
MKAKNPNQSYYIISAIRDLDGYKQNTDIVNSVFLSKQLWTIFGIFTNFENAEKEVLNDKGHTIYQNLYQYVVIQRFNYGLWVQADKQYWYKWNDSTNSYQKIKKPRKLPSHCVSCI